MNERITRRLEVLKRQIDAAKSASIKPTDGLTVPTDVEKYHAAKNEPMPPGVSIVDRGRLCIGHIGVLMCSLILFGCGGGSNPQESLTPCEPKSTVRVQLFGDSTQEGYVGATGVVADRSPAKLLQSAMDARFGVGTVVVDARAVQGTTAVELVAGRDGLNLPWPGSLAAEIVVINHGINDMTHHGDSAAYRAALDTIAGSGARVVFETPNVVKHYDVAPWAQAMRSVAAHHGAAVADVHDYTSSLTDWQSLIPDWAHPSEKLYAMISADVLVPAVTAAVKAEMCL